MGLETIVSIGLGIGGAIWGGKGAGDSSEALPPIPSPEIKMPLPAAAPPGRKEPGTRKATLDLKERLRRARSRSLSRITEMGFLEEAAPTRRPMLSDILR